jgi:hypothetical protein
MQQPQRNSRRIGSSIPAPSARHTGSNINVNSNINNEAPNNSSHSSGVETTPESNKRQSVGRGSSNLNSSGNKVVPSPSTTNRNSLRLSSSVINKDSSSNSSPVSSPNIKNRPATSSLTPPQKPLSEVAKVVNQQQLQSPPTKESDASNVPAGSLSTILTTRLPSTSKSVVSDASSVSSPVNEQTLIQVCVRIRPLLNEEILYEGNCPVWSWKENQITPIPFHQRNNSVSSGSSVNSNGPNFSEYSLANPNAIFTFDQLFSPESTNYDIFNSVIKDIVVAGMNGYHGSVFTYGQTSSGKTFTMYGEEIPSSSTPVAAPSSSSSSSPAGKQIGVITQTIQYCFHSINNFPNREFLLRVSYLEVYNEQVKDLLSTDSRDIPIKILYDPKAGTVLSGVKEHVVFNPNQVFALIKQGEQHRHIGVTDMNAKSSRAHTLFKIIIESKDRGNTSSGSVRVSTLNLVDLAGSENAKMTNSIGERAREAKHINQSLLTLSTIIQRLSEDHSSNKRSHHLPYRDSKLTRLLESALDGNARIAIICNISPTSKCIEESVNTLKFGTRAKLIKIHAKINDIVDDKTLLKAYREEIEQLKNKLKEFEEKQTIQHSLPDHPRTPGLRSRPSNYLSSDASVNSIELTASNSKDQITDTIHQIEDKLMFANHISLVNSPKGGGLMAVTGNDVDDTSRMLQMIEAMERLILKADNTKQQASKSMRQVKSSEGGDLSNDKALYRSSSGTSALSGEGGGGNGEGIIRGRSMKKGASFATGIPINSMTVGGAGRSGIPTRKGSSSLVSRSQSNDRSLDPIHENEEVVKPLASNDSMFDLMEGKRGSGAGGTGNQPQVLSPNSKSAGRKNSKHYDVSLDYSMSNQPTPKSLETAVVVGEGEEGAAGENDERGQLIRQTSIPLSDLQNNYNKLENNAEKLGISTTVGAGDGLNSHPSVFTFSPHSVLAEKPRSSSATGMVMMQENDENNNNLIERQGSVSPLTVSTIGGADGVHLPSILIPSEQQHQLQYGNSLPPLSGGIALFSPSHGGGGGATTPMKNRVVRKPGLTPGSGTEAMLSNMMMQQQHVGSKDNLHSMSQDTYDSFQSSIMMSNDVVMEDDSVLLGVSKMLTLLKDYIAKPVTAR